MDNLLKVLTEKNINTLISVLKKEDELQFKFFMSLINTTNKGKLESSNSIKINQSEKNKFRRNIENHIYDIILENNVSNYFSNSYDKQEVSIKKEIILTKFLISNELYSKAKNVLLKVIKNSVKYEMYKYALEASRELLSLSKITYSKKDILKYINLSEHYNRWYNIMIDSEMIYSQAMLFHESRKNDDFIEYCIQNLPILKKNMKSINSSLVGYMFYELSSKFYIEKHQTKKSLKYVVKLIEHLENNKLIFSKKWIGEQKLKLADICLINNNYQEGIDYIKEAIPLLKHNRFKYSQALDTYYHLTLNNGQIDERNKILNQMRRLDLSSIDIYYSEKIKFYIAACYFSKGDITMTLDILQKLKTLTKDKKGWGLGVKLLEIMSLYNLEMFDLLDYKLHNFRMFIYNQKISNDKRLKAIYSCLRILRHQNNKGIELNPKKFQIHIENLKSNLNEYQWNPKGYETIRFDSWLSKILEHR